MEEKDISVLINNKIKINSEIVVFKYYEMKIEKNLKEKELLATMNLISIKLNNLGYKVYRTGQKYNYKNKEYYVETDKLMIGFKITK